jgi:hypothetical protein
LRQQADLHAALGESYLMAGKAERAIDKFKTLIALDPSARCYTEAILELANLRMKNKEVRRSR